uniref:Uncharacterized protein n=1 Tax=Arundo donax TaxID=35708 RepID=A0A0A9ETX5_ARUDO
MLLSTEPSLFAIPGSAKPSPDVVPLIFRGILPKFQLELENF